MRRLTLADLKEFAITFFVGCVTLAALFAVVLLALWALGEKGLKILFRCVGVFMIGTFVRGIWRCK